MRAGLIASSRRRSGGGITPVSFIGADSAGGNVSTLTGINWPTVEAGDFALLYRTASTGITFQAHADFTNYDPIAGISDDACRSHLSYRVCTGSEDGGAVDLFVNAGPTRQTAVLIVYRGIASIHSQATRGESVSTVNHDCPSLTPSIADAVILTMMSERVSSGTAVGTPPAGWSKRTGSEAAAVGSGGTYTGVADDGLITPRSAGVAVDPGNFVGQVATGTCVTRTVALVRA